ncbi:MAG TPA: hypothetical protein VKM72_23600 [Thermoanaerobaculia bacterium]|nr:hypothetical protein [Thermoanaerobaculia bacterium]
MNTPTYNGQFLTIDFRMLDNPAFGEFMKTTAFAVYLQLRRYIWRSRVRRHPISQVNELFEQGHLVATAERSFLAKKLGIKEERHISRHITDLCRMGVVKRISTGRQNIYVLGRWEDRSVQQDGSYVIELFLLEQHFGVEKRPQINPQEGTMAESPEDASTESIPGVSLTDTSGVPPSDTPEVSPVRTPRVSAARTSGVSKKPPYKYRGKQIEKQQQAVLLLREFSFSQEQLQEITATHPFERISEVVAAYQQRGEGKIENPAGWVLAALRGHYEFDSVEKRLRAKQERRRIQETAETSQATDAESAREESAARIQAWIEAHPEEYRQILEEERQKWNGSTVGQSTSYLQSCARVRVLREKLAAGQDEAAPFVMRTLHPAAARSSEAAMPTGSGGATLARAC